MSDLVPIFEVLVEISFVSSDCETVSLSVETAISDVVLFCNSFAFIFMPMLPFLTKVDEFFLLDDDPMFLDHNDILETFFAACPEVSYVTINDFFNTHIQR